jgi:hypothetical protein|tara:strand:+ start:1625 stop:1825 length:201 start_codon:yes stop_codon:yes gene_type:complete
MKNRNLIYKKLENLEFTLTNLRRIVNTQEPIETYKVNIEKALGLLDNIKDIVESQPLGPSEINPIR